MIGKYIGRHVARALEERTSGYTSLLLAGLESEAAGTAGNFLATGALEVAAGVWARTLASATVTGEGAGVLTRRIRHRIGRDLIREGESVHLIETADGPALRTPARFHVRKGWRYELDMPEPEGATRRITVPRGRVLHLVWSEDPLQPWRGQGPLQVASILADLTVKVESKLREDLSTPIAHLVPIPSDGGDTQLDSLRSDISGAKGGAVLAEATSTGWDDDRTQSGTRRDWKGERLGPMIPEAMRSVWGDVCAMVAGACGVPASLVAPIPADGTRLREDYRRFTMQAVQPVADLIAEAVSEAFEMDVGLDFASLHAHDVQGRSSALKRLVEAGIPLDEARRLVGWG